MNLDNNEKGSYPHGVGCRAPKKKKCHLIIPDTTLHNYPDIALITLIPHYTSLESATLSMIPCRIPCACIRYGAAGTTATTFGQANQAKLFFRHRSHIAEKKKSLRKDSSDSTPLYAQTIFQSFAFFCYVFCWGIGSSRVVYRWCLRILVNHVESRRLEHRGVQVSVYRLCWM